MDQHGYLCAPYPAPIASLLLLYGGLLWWLKCTLHLRTVCADYFSTERFLDALDYYAQAMPIDKLGVGMMNRDDISSDGYVARFHAIKSSGAKELDMFIMRKHARSISWSILHPSLTKPAMPWAQTPAMCH